MFDFERDEITDRLAEKFHFDPGVLGTLNDIWAMGIPDIGEPDIILATTSSVRSRKKIMAQASFNGISSIVQCHVKAGRGWRSK